MPPAAIAGTPAPMVVKDEAPRGSSDAPAKFARRPAPTTKVSECGGGEKGGVLGGGGEGGGGDGGDGGRGGESGGTIGGGGGGEGGGGGGEGGGGGGGEGGGGEGGGGGGGEGGGRGRGDGGGGSGGIAQMKGADRPQPFCPRGGASQSRTSPLRKWLYHAWHPPGSSSRMSEHWRPMARGIISSVCLREARVGHANGGGDGGDGGGSGGGNGGGGVSVGGGGGGDGGDGGGGGGEQLNASDLAQNLSSGSSGGEHR